MSQSQSFPAQPDQLKDDEKVIAVVRMLRTSLSSCSTSLRVMGGKVRSGLGATAAEGRTLDLATLVSQQRPLEDKDHDGHKEKL